MSDVPQGPGWWQASDGLWYSPDQLPGAQPVVPDPATAGGPGPGPDPWATGPGAWAAAGPPVGNALDVGSGMSWAWRRFTEHLGTWVGLALVPVGVMLLVGVAFLVALAPAGIGDAGSALAVVLMLLVLVAGIVISLVMSRGLYRAALAVCDGRPPEIGMLFQFDAIGPFIVVSLLYGLAVAIGTVLCVIPGIIAAVAFVWAPYAVVDQGMAPMDAMRRSWQLTTSRLGEVVLYLLVVYLVTSLAGFVCFVLSFFTTPFLLLAVAWAWRRMHGQPLVA